MEIKYVGRVLPLTGKQHQNQEVASGGGLWSLKATDYKGIPKALVRYENKTNDDNSESDKNIYDTTK